MIRSRLPKVFQECDASRTLCAASINALHADSIISVFRQPINRSSSTVNTIRWERRGRQWRSLCTSRILAHQDTSEIQPSSFLDRYNSFRMPFSSHSRVAFFNTNKLILLKSMFHQLRMLYQRLLMRKTLNVKGLRLSFTVTLAHVLIYINGYLLYPLQTKDFRMEFNWSHVWLMVMKSRHLVSMQSSRICVRTRR